MDRLDGHLLVIKGMRTPSQVLCAIELPSLYREWLRDLEARVMELDDAIYASGCCLEPDKVRSSCPMTTEDKIIRKLDEEQTLREYAREYDQVKDALQRELMNRLSTPRRYQAAVMVWVQGHSIGDVADYMGVRDRQVYKLLADARKELLAGDLLRDVQ